MYFLLFTILNKGTLVKLSVLVRPLILTLVNFFYVNSVYRPEGTGIDTSNALGLTELAGIYNTFLVYEADCTLRITNEEAFEVIVSMAPSTVPLTIGTNAIALQLGELPYGVICTLGRNSGQNRSALRIRLPLAQFYGNRTHYHADNQFFGGSAVRPSTLCRMYFAIACLTPNTFVNGVTYSFNVTYKVKWSGRIFNDILGLAIANRRLIRIDQPGLAQMPATVDDISDESELSSSLSSLNI